MQIKEYNLVGVNVAKLTQEELLDFIKYSIEFDTKSTIAYQNLHGLFLLKKHEYLNDFFKKDVVTLVDGMPLILIAKLLKYDLVKENRLAWIDFMNPLLELAGKNKWKIFYLGTSQDTVETIKTKVQLQYGLQISGHNGFFNADKYSTDNTSIINEINAFNPDILIVGMSMPRQEVWILENKEMLNAKLIMTCGAAFEFLAGTAKIPPRWLGNFGLEWLYRFIGDPKKLWYRYLIEPWYVLIWVAKAIGKNRT